MRDIQYLIKRFNSLKPMCHRREFSGDRKGNKRQEIKDENNKNNSLTEINSFFCH